MKRFLKGLAVAAAVVAPVMASVPANAASANIFVIQGGGYTWSNSAGPVAIAQNAPVVNEFKISNTRGTIAMAKLGSDPNSATNQWFFNLA